MVSMNEFVVLERATLRSACFLKKLASMFSGNEPSWNQHNMKTSLVANLNVGWSWLLWKLWEDWRSFRLDLRERRTSRSELERLGRSRGAPGGWRDGHGPARHRGGLNQPRRRRPRRGSPHWRHDGGEPAAQGWSCCAGRGGERGHVPVGSHRVDPMGRVHDRLHACKSNQNLYHIEQK